MSISAAPERSLGLAGSLVKGRYKINAVSSITRDVVLYAAEELRFGRPLTLKVLRDDVADNAEFVAGVRNLARTLALSPHAHRGLPRVYECGATDTGELFVALEPIEGVTLREVLDARGNVDRATALRVTSQVGEILETLHHSGIVHGQLRPETVLLVKDEGGGEHVLLVDVELTAAYRTAFGRGRREASASTYLGPEQVESGETSEKSDQYALGMLLRELLTADAERQATDGQAGVPPVSPDIARILTTALDSRPERRFPDISVMVNELWAAQTALTEPAPRPRSDDVSRKSHRRQRHRRPQATLRIAVAVATAGIISAAVWLALSGVLISRGGGVIDAPAVSAVPAAPAAAPSPDIRLMPPTPAASPQVPTTVHALPAIETTSTGESLAHPSAAPRPAPVVHAPAAAVVDRTPERVVETATAPDQSPSDANDGSAIIDWVLKRRR